jgi:hypothetical protein
MMIAVVQVTMLRLTMLLLFMMTYPVTPHQSPET